LAKERALNCGNGGELPELVFSAPPTNLTLTTLRQLVRFEPAVNDLSFESFGSRVRLKGSFRADTLYTLTFGPAPLIDDTQRAIRPVPNAAAFFHVGFRTPSLRFVQSTALLEAYGPHAVRLEGFGERQADVRVHRIDPLARGLWPFPKRVPTTDDDARPPFPGEEPVARSDNTFEARDLSPHLRLLGTPLVSTLVSLPFTEKPLTQSVPLDLKPLLDPVVGTNRPGTYLVGLRRVSTRSERHWMRVQITNLSLTALDQETSTDVFVRRLDNGQPLAGARIRIDGTRQRSEAEQAAATQKNSEDRSAMTAATFTVDCDEQGKATLKPLTGWQQIGRIVVSAGDDALVLEPETEIPTFAANHWAGSRKLPGTAPSSLLIALSIAQAKRSSSKASFVEQRTIFFH
jgi:alpha-2-macroglobulin